MNEPTTHTPYPLRVRGEMTTRSNRSAGRSGFVVGAIVNAVLLWMVNVQPGWDAVPFFTDETPRVLPLVNLSLTAGLVTNLVYLMNNGPRVHALGELITSSVGLVAAVRILQVFPFDLDEPYPIVVQVILVVAVVGSAIAIVVNLVALLRRSSRRERADEAGSRIRSFHQPH